MNTSRTTVSAKATTLSPTNWFGKASAGLLLGFSLSLALSGLLAWLVPGPLQPFNGKHQLAMWSIGLFWNLVLAACFLFRDGKRAWLWLGLANVVSYGLLFGGRALFF